MAIRITSISKLRDKIYNVTVEDTLTGKTYSEQHNTNLSAEDLMKKIEAAIKDGMVRDADAAAVESVIKSAVESIDPSKISLEE